MTKDGARKKSADRQAVTKLARPAPEPLGLGPLPGYTGYLLRRAQLALFDNFISSFKPLGLRPAQFSVLLVMNANPGRRQSEIAAALGIRQANLVGLIDDLDRRGLAKRKRLLTDRRSHALVLTAKGNAILKKGLALQAQFEERLVGELGAAEHARLIASLRKLHGVLTSPEWSTGNTAPPRRRTRKAEPGNGKARVATQH